MTSAYKCNLSMTWRTIELKSKLIPVFFIVIGAVLITAALVWTFTQYSASSSPQSQSSADTQDIYPHIERVTAADAKQAFDQGAAEFVDVRDLEEFEQAHIPGAISIPVYEVASRTGELDPEDWIITY